MNKFKIRKLLITGATVIIMVASLIFAIVAAFLYKGGF